MSLSITDPAFLFPGISLLFLAFTNRYLTLAGIIRSLSTYVDQHKDPNREQQIRAIHMRIMLIKYMQACGIIAFLFCIFSMLAILMGSQSSAKVMFVSSLGFMIISLLLSLAEVLKSGQSLKLELRRTHKQH